MEGIQQKIQSVGDKIAETWSKIWTTVKNKASEIWTAIKTTISTIFTAIHDFIQSVIDKIKTIWEESWTKVKTTVTTIWTGIKATVTEKFTAVKDKIEEILGKIKDKWSEIWNGMKSTLKGVINGIIGLINSMLDSIAGGINHVIDALNSLSVDIPDWVPGVGGSHFGLSISHVSAPHVPTLANGGITTGATLAMIGEAGREAVLPLESNTGWIDELAGKLGDIMGARESGINAVTLEVDGTELARVSLDAMVSEIQRRGYTADIVFG